MAHLFSPITIARTKIANRIVMAPIPSGYATLDGFIGGALVEYYAQRARGGVGLIITEPVRIVAPEPDNTRVHIGLYADTFVPQLRRMTERVHESDTRILVTLDAPAKMVQGSVPFLRSVAERFVLAAWRALSAGFDGIMLSAADGGVLHTILSPLTNHRFDEYGKNLDGRLLLLLQVIEGIRRWMGNRLLIGVRFVADEFITGGTTLQDARMIASHVTASGANLLDVTADTRHNAQVAHFPGWCLPLASGVKRYIPDIPVIGSGLLGEPYLADSVIRDGSIDLVMLGQTLRNNPEWPNMARSFLTFQPG